MDGGKLKGCSLRVTMRYGGAWTDATEVADEIFRPATLTKMPSWHFGHKNSGSPALGS